MDKYRLKQGEIYTKYLIRKWLYKNFGFSNLYSHVFGFVH